MLSLAALRFTSKHLEFNAHPSDLQRPYLARRLLFGGSGSGGKGEPAAAINFSVLITEDNKAKIAVAVDSAGGSKWQMLSFLNFELDVFFPQKRATCTPATPAASTPPSASPPLRWLFPPPLRLSFP